jgi:hypothetical protein
MFGGGVTVAVLVSEKLAGVVIPATEAVTVYGPPTVPLAVNVLAVATPAPLVVAVVVTVPLANVPLAPVPGAVNTTLTPDSRFPPLSFTAAASSVPNAVLIVALCGVPAVAVTLAGVPVVFVSE